jgi:hypothetical protein
LLEKYEKLDTKYCVVYLYWSFQNRLKNGCFYNLLKNKHENAQEVNPNSCVPDSNRCNAITAYISFLEPKNAEFISWQLLLSIALCMLLLINKL